MGDCRWRIENGHRSRFGIALAGLIVLLFSMQSGFRQGRIDDVGTFNRAD